MDRPTAREIAVHIAHAPSEDAIQRLEADLDPSISLTVGPQDMPAATAILVSGRPSKEDLAACPLLRVLIVPYAGIPAPTRDLILADFPHLAVHNLHHNAAAAAELAMALLLAAAKTIVPADRALRQSDWRTRYDGAQTLILDGKTAVVLGLGAIGTRIAAICRAFGMDVHGVRRRPDLPTAEPITVHGLSELPAILPLADALIVCLPLTSETEGLIGDRELRLLRPSAVLVNVARGAIVEEKALYGALKERRIAAAGIDVWYRYPSAPEERRNTPPSQYPFHELDNVVMSPHRGGAYRTAELEEQRMRDLAVSLNAAARGGAIPHPVDLAAGY